MEKTLIELIYKNRILDNKTIELIIKNEIEKQNLHKQINSIRFVDDNNNFGSYDSLYNIININYNLILECLLKSLKNLKIDKNSKEANVLINTKILQIIIHEIQHAYQSSIIEDNNYEKKVIRKILQFTNTYYMGYESNIVEKKKFIQANYKFMPDEYNAEFMSLQKLAKICKNQEISQYLFNPDYYLVSLIEYIKESYNNGTPINKFLQASNRKISDFKYEELNQEQALEYGFPIKKIKLNV